MEKICIVKLRRKIGTPAQPEDKAEFEASRKPESPPDDPHGAIRSSGDNQRPDIGRSAPGETDEGSNSPGAKVEKEEKSVSLTLTLEQTEALRSHRRFMPLLDGDFTHEAKGTDSRGESIVFRFEFGQMPSPRFLKPSEVLQMLRISSSLLNNLVRKEKLKTYRIGRLRRFLLDDIFSYMEDNRNHVNPRGKP